MPVYSPESSLELSKPTPIDFYSEEAMGYLESWCLSHYAWAPLELGTFSQRLALEKIGKKSWAWALKWTAPGSFEHPVTRKYVSGKRFCFILSEDAFTLDDVKIHEKAVDLRAWVTCFEDDVIAVKIELC